MANTQKNDAISALQDVRKMRRAVRLRESTNPIVVSELLKQILNEILIARQALGNSRLGKNAVKELARVRNDLITGSIDAGPRQAEFITKFTTVFNELKNIDQEEKDLNKSEAIEEAKSTLRSIIPRKEMILSGIIAANPILGYGLKIGGSLGRGLTNIGRNKTDLSPKVDTIRKKALEIEEESISNEIEKYSNSDHFSENDLSILAAKLDLIREELKLLRSSSNDIEKISADTKDDISNIEKLNKEQIDLEKESNFRLARERKETKFETYDDQLLADIDKQTSNQKNNMISSILGDAGSSLLGIGSSAAMGGALGAGGALLLGAKILLGAALVAAVGFALWKYRDEVSDYIIDPLKSFFRELFEGGDVGGALAIEGGTKGIKQNIDSTVNRQQSIIDLADADSKVLEAKSARDEAETMKDNLETSLDILETEWDRLVEQSNRELDETGLISDKTREAMLINNEAQQQVKEQIDNAKDELKRLVEELRNITIERRSFYRDNYTPEERTRLLNGESVGAPSSLLDYIGEKESGGNYNALVYGRRGFDTPSQTNLSDMTIGEVQDYQAGMYSRGHASSAVGKYQFIQDTLRDAVESTPGIDMDTKFTPEVQDRLATTLLNRRGLKEYQSGELSLEDFTKNLSYEWASLPLSNGLSAYEGIAGNTTSTDYNDYLGVVRDSKNDMTLELDRDTVSDSSESNPSDILSEQLDYLSQMESNEKTNKQNAPVIVNNQQQPAVVQPQRLSPAIEPENHDKSWRQYMFNQNSFGAAL